MRTAYWAINQEKKETYMSKNLTRKGLALGAVVALGSSLFAGTPANANPTALFLASAFGTNLEGVLGQNFVLSGTAAGAADGNDVSYYIEGVAAADLDVVGRYTTDLSLDISSAGAYTASADANGETITSSGLILEQDTTPSTKKATIKVDTWKAGSALQFAIKVNATNVTATTSVKVTPFLDNVLADGIPGANELTGSAVTIVFNKATELTATPTVKAPSLGSNVKASVAVTKVNLEQFRTTAKGAPAAQSFVNVDFIEDGVTTWAVDKAPLWDTVTSEFVADSADTPNASSIYGAKAQFGSTDSASASTVTAAKGEVATMSNTSIRTGSSYKATGVLSTSNVIRSGSGSVTARSTVLTAVATKSVANQTVSYKIVESGVNTLPIGATITAGGKTLTIASTTVAEFIEVDVKTSAAGHADLVIAYTGVTVGKTFNIFAKALGASASIVSTGSGTIGSEVGNTPLTLMGEDSVATALVNPVESSHSGTAVYRVARSGSYSIPMTVVDQFGQLPSGSFRVVVTNSGSSTTTTAINSPVALSGGTATVAGTDTSTADGSYTVTSTLQKLGTDGSTWSAVGSVNVIATVSVGAAQTAGAITLNSTSVGVGRNGAALVAGNSDLEQGTVARTLANGTTLSATVTSTTGANAVGVPVTFSAAGVLFRSGDVYGLGSITVNTDTSGTVGDVIAYSTIGGKSTITVTSGSATKTQVLTWATETDATLADSWTVTAPVSILPGQSLKVSAVLKDEFGAIINTPTVADRLKIVYTGPGFVTAALPTETDADGVVSFTVLLGAADSGTATVKFVAAGVNTTMDETTLNDDIVATASIIIGAAPVAASATSAAIAGSTKRFFVSVSNNTGAKNVVVKVAGRTFATLKGSTAAKKTYVVRAPKGSHKVTVFVGGKLIATKTISVK
jgi:hypothetical protein